MKYQPALFWLVCLTNGKANIFNNHLLNTYLNTLDSLNTEPLTILLVQKTGNRWKYPPNYRPRFGYTYRKMHYGLYLWHHFLREQVSFVWCLPASIYACVIDRPSKYVDRGGARGPVKVNTIHTPFFHLSYCISCRHVAKDRKIQPVVTKLTEFGK